MKGMSHFIAGLAAASCVPAAVAAAADGNPLYFVLAGITGLLPDTVDFKWYRYLYPCREEVIPDSRAPDARVVADALARAVRRAYEGGAPVRLRLSTVRLPRDRWLPYAVAFDPAARAVTATFEYPDNDGCGEDTVRDEIAFRQRTASARLPCDILLEHDAVTRVDILDGPVWRFARTAGGVSAMFIPWHRRWSHSFAFTVAVAGLAGMLIDTTAALVALLAGLLHIAMDQLGHMGSALWWPFSDARVTGLQRLHATDAWPNLAAVWMALLLVFWNLARFTPGIDLHLNPIRLFVWAGIVPLLVARLLLIGAPPRPTPGPGRTPRRGRRQLADASHPDHSNSGVDR